MWGSIVLVANNTTNQLTLCLVSLRCTNTQMGLDSSLQQSLFLKVTFTVCVPLDSTGDIYKKKKTGREGDFARLACNTWWEKKKKAGAYFNTISVLSENLCMTQLETKAPISAHPRDSLYGCWGGQLNDACVLRGPQWRVESGAFQLLLRITIKELKGEVCQLHTKILFKENFCICEKSCTKPFVAYQTSAARSSSLPEAIEATWATTSTTHLNLWLSCQ